MNKSCQVFCWMPGPSAVVVVRRIPSGLSATRKSSASAPHDGFLATVIRKKQRSARSLLGFESPTSWCCARRSFAPQVHDLKLRNWHRDPKCRALGTGPPNPKNLNPCTPCICPQGLERFWLSWSTPAPQRFKEIQTEKIPQANERQEFGSGRGEWI